MTRPQEREFEFRYQQWIRSGEQYRDSPIDDDYERERRQAVKVAPKRCPHGLTKLTCSICYLYEGQSGWGGLR